MRTRDARWGTPLNRDSRARAIRATTALAVLALGIMVAASLVPPARAAQLRSFYDLTIVINYQDSPAIRFTFFLDSPFNGTNPITEAETVTVTATGDGELLVNGTVNGTWTTIMAHANGDVYIDMDARMADSALASIAADPGATHFSTLTVVVVYTDSEGAKPRTIQRPITFPLNYRPPPSLGLFPAAAAGLGGAGGVGLLLYVGRRARLEDLYLMHDSGLLIRHWARTNGSTHDSEIMSGMLIVLQEFVRDSFKEPHGNLEHLRFGKQQVVMARGAHTVLAAVVRGKFLNGLPRRLSQTVVDFERSYSEALVHWSGNVDQFPLADVLVLRFLKGRTYGPAA